MSYLGSIDDRLMAGATRAYHATDPRPRIASVMACTWTTKILIDVMTLAPAECWMTGVWLLLVSMAYVHHVFEWRVWLRERRHERGAARFFLNGERWYRRWLFFASLVAWVLVEAVPRLYEPCSTYNPLAIASGTGALSSLGMAHLVPFFAYQAVRSVASGPAIVELVALVRPKLSPRTGRGYLCAVFAVSFFLFAVYALVTYFLLPPRSVVS
jgi:hypothetical protein